MRLAILIFCLLFSGPATAGPLLLAIAVWAGTTVAVVALTLAVVTLTVGTMVYGASQARKAERQARDATNAAMRDRMTNRIATEAAHRHIYGRAKVGSSVVAMFTSGNKDQFRHLVCVHANHECDAIEEVYVNNIPVGVLSGAGDATVGRYSTDSNSGVEEEKKVGPTFTLNYKPFAPTVRVYSGAGVALQQVPVTSISGTTVTVAYTGPVTVVYDRSIGRLFGDAISNINLPNSTPLVRVKVHLGGENDPVDSYLNSILPAKWPSTAVLRGMCYTVITLDLNHAEFQGGQVPIHALIRGKKLYDPRTGLTAWSQNPALAIRDYLTGPLCDVPAGDLPAAQFIAAANVCDEVINGAPRYTLNGDVTSDQTQANILEKMAQCMAGGIVSTTWDITAGKYIAPVMALDQSDIVGGVKITPGPSDSVTYNGVKGQYISSENSYILTDFKPYQNSTYREKDQRDLYTNIDFPFTDSLQRVTNLARIFTEDQRNGFTVSAEFSLKAWPLKVGQRVSFTSQFFGQTAKVYRITDKSFSPSSAVQLTLKEDDASIWDFADAVVVDSTPNTNLANPFEIAPLASLTLSAGEATLLRQSDGSTLPRMLVSWPLAPTLSVQDTGQIEIEWRAVGSTVWSKTSVPGSVTEAYLSPITPGWAYVVRACCANPYVGTKSNWVSNQYQVQVFQANPVVYAWSASRPAAPAGTGTYVWVTSSYAAPSGWSLTVPAAPSGGNETLWEARVLVSDISSADSTLFYWSISEISAIGYAPAAAGTGPAGFSNARVLAYQRSASAPTGTPGAVNYDFSTGTITTATLANGWLKTIPASDGNPLYVTSASASAAGTTDSIASGEWSGAVVLAYDGGAGTPGLNNATVTLYQRAATATAPTRPTATTTYTFATGALTGVNNGWTTYIPSSGGAYLHTTFATAIATTATDTIAAGEWAAVQLMYDAADLIAAKDALTAIFADNVLSRDEKPDLIQKWAAIGGEYELIGNHATALGVSKVAYFATITALGNYLSGITPAYTDLTQNSPIVRADANAAWNNYYAAKVALQLAMDAKIKADALADATAKANAAQANAIATAATAAQAKADLAETTAKAYADGIVTAEEARAIADATAKANAAQAAATAAAALLDGGVDRGAFLNTDPNFRTGAQWEIINNESYAQINFNYPTTAGGAESPYCVYPGNPAGSGGAQVWLLDYKKYPIDPTKVYELAAKLFADVGNNRTAYLGLEFFDGAGTRLTTAWGGGWSGYPWSGVPTAGTFNRYAGKFGPGTGKVIPATAAMCRVGIILNYGGNSNTRMAAQGLKLSEFVENNATVGAPAGTLVAGVDAATVAAGAANGTAAIAPLTASIGGLYDVDTNGNANTSTYVVIDTQTATTLGGTGPYVYTFNMQASGSLRIKSVSGATVTIEAKGVNVQASGILTCTSIDSRGRTIVRVVYLYVGFGTGQPL